MAESALYGLLVDTTLRQLADTEQQVRLLQTVQENRTRSLQVINHQQDQLVELRRKRQKLLDEIDELHAARTQPRTLKGRLGATMAAGEPGSGAGAGDGLDPDAVQELVIRQTAAEKKLRDWVDVHGAYRLAGRTVFPDRDSTVAVRFETLFGGRYHETYYVWLRLHHESDRFVLTRYTVPPVVPIEQLAREHLGTDLTAFLDAVDDYLQPFVSRREQVRALRDAVDGAVVRLTVDATFTSLHAEFPLQPAQELFVVYEDARSSQPTRVRAFRQRPAPVPAAPAAAQPTAQPAPRPATTRWPDAEAAFHRRRLADAFFEAFPDARKRSAP